MSIFKKFKKEALIRESDGLQLNVKNSEFVSPKDMRRIDLINSLLLTDGESENITFKAGKPRESNRATSFTRDRR